MKNYTDVEHGIVEESKERPVLKVATFNIVRNNEKEEIGEIFDHILRYEPDVLAIQGLTKQNCEAVFRIMKKSGYSFSRFDHTGAPREDFEILFTKNAIPVLKKEYTPFNKSIQNRGLSKYLITAGAHTNYPINVWIFTSKLEEGASGNTIRKTQIVDISAAADMSAATAAKTPIIFAGDTSIPSWQSIDNAYKCPSGWYDAWKERGTCENEKTSLHDRMDQIWFTQKGACASDRFTITDFSRIRISTSDDVRAGICATFTA